MGPGPSDAPPSVLNAMSQPLIGHLDPSFIQMMEEIKDMLRQVFLTGNDMTFPISGTGSAGMEFCFVNLIEPGDEVIIFEPYYENYGPDAILTDATPRFVKLNPPDWTFDEKEVAAAFNDKTKASVPEPTPTA